MTKTLNLLGAHLPETLMQPSAANEAGFFESTALYSLHERLLEAAGSSWFDWRRMPAHWCVSPASRPFVEDIARIVHAEYGDADLLVIKDPRICRFVPLWLDVLQAIEAQPIFVLPFRHPLAVTGSLQARDGFPAWHGQLLWLRHVLDAEFASRGYPRAFVPYQGLLEEPRREIDRLRTNTPGAAWPHESAEMFREIERFLDPGLQHQIVDADRADCADIFDWARGAYDAYRRLQADPADGPALASLDTIRGAFDAAADVFAPALEEMQVLHEARAADLHQQLDRSQNELEASRGIAAQIPSLELTLAELRRQSNRASLALAASNERLRMLQPIADRVPDLARELAQAQSSLQAGAVTRQVMAARHDALERALQDERTRGDMLEAVTARVPGLEHELAALQQRSSLVEQAFAARVEGDAMARSRTASSLVKRWLPRSPARIHAERCVARRMRFVEDWGGFDRVWYLAANPDVLARGLDPVLHFCTYGMAEGRRPNSDIDDDSFSRFRDELDHL